MLAMILCHNKVGRGGQVMFLHLNRYMMMMGKKSNAADDQKTPDKLPNEKQKDNLPVLDCLCKDAKQ
eukprot:11977826-Ditylum_brightwellii.AAC.1